MGISVVAMFAVWLAYGVFQWRRSELLFGKMARIARAKRPALALVFLLGGAVILLAGLYGVFLAGGFSGRNVSPWAWPLCVALGLIFVHCQVLAGVLLVSHAVTPPSPEPSQTKESQT